jgi:hypothetical protein
MAKIKLGLEGDSSSVYELIKILEIKGCDGNIIYEIHNQSDIKGYEPLSEFVNRSKPFYKSFINPGFVDLWASECISYAAKVDELWYFASDVGSNTYLGAGPTSVLSIREYCFKHSIKILYVEENLEQWIEKLFSKELSEIKVDPTNEIRTISQSYNEVNLIIKRCGDGIARIIDTADKLSETNYRDLFLSAAHSHTKYTIEAEATNRKGRTDLKIYDKLLEIPYIYEFKIHRTNADIKKGLTQITRQYATVLNRKNGLIFINKKQSDLSIIMTSIKKALEKDKLDINDINLDSNQHIIIVKHKHHLDKTINCILSIFLFDIQQLKDTIKKGTQAK